MTIEARTSNTNAFPVIRAEHWGAECPKFVKWDALNEEWAQRNHGQSLQRLADRCGLDPTEIVANIEERAWHNMDMETAIHVILHIAVAP